MKNPNRILLLWILASPAISGSFDSFSWQMGMNPAQGHFQVTLKIEYSYDATSGFNPQVLGLPDDSNLKMIRMIFKVDGKKVAYQKVDQTTWWSFGKSVSTYLPSKEGTRISGEAFYIIKNLFLIPPAPTNLPEPVKKLLVGFAPSPGFNLTGSFIGKQYKFKSQRLAHRAGDPPVAYNIKRRNVEAGTTQEFLFLIPTTFTFSFNSLRAAQWDPSQTDPTTSSGGDGSLATLFGGTGGYNAGTAGSGNQDTNAGHKGFSITGDLKPYSANFYKGNPSRDWHYALTWLQQERTYLPFGIQPGGAVKSRSLFNGAGDKGRDLLPWIDPARKTHGDAVTDEEVSIPDAPDVNQAMEIVANIELFIAEFRQGLKIDYSASSLIAYTTGQGMDSPAMVNRELANALTTHFGVKTAPTLTSIFPQERMVALPLSAFKNMITAIRIGKNWFFVDAANPAWTIKESSSFMAGHSIIILEEDHVQMGAF